MYKLIEPKNCFVAMFDILGFKALREKEGTQGLHQLFNNGILPMMMYAAAEGKTKEVVLDGKLVSMADFSEDNIKFRIISDTILFYTKDDSFISFIKIVSSAFLLLVTGFGGLKAPYRGAIGWGDLIEDSYGILIGSAIEDAYKGESLQVWSGAMLTELCYNYCNERKYIEQYAREFLEASERAPSEIRKKELVAISKRLILYPVPTQINPKNGSVVYNNINTYAVNWTLNLYEGAGANAFYPPKDDHAATIIKNTIAFENWAFSLARKGPE